jgi:PAS domain S-box-containing protein
MERKPDILDRLTNTADGVFAVDPKGTIILWNASAERILGFTAKEVLGKNCCDVVAGRDAFGNRLCHRGCHVMTMVGQGEQVQSYDMLTRTKGGKEIWINVSILVIPGSRQEYQVTLHLFRDVTASRQLEQFVRERSDGARPAVDREQATDPGQEELTRREHQILRLIAGGSNTQAVAEALHVSPATVRNHVQNLLGKLGVHSRLEAVAYAIHHRLL